ncbi:hypothetical protein P186_0326 [Pyrobaculum ferrireducens]|uniref:Uncharacterized protein n=1 Tax=Pyrobaculum ferrireducens TaxID=1104324 RepID=G7VFX4_9CREN|nr:hypothetical protein P186_0326 [Pyrobaculum ferrireducens]
MISGHDTLLREARDVIEHAFQLSFDFWEMAEGSLPAYEVALRFNYLLISGARFQIYPSFCLKICFNYLLISGATQVPATTWQVQRPFQLSFDFWTSTEAYYTLNFMVDVSTIF